MIPKIFDDLRSVCTVLCASPQFTTRQIAFVSEDQKERDSFVEAAREKNLKDRTVKV